MRKSIFFAIILAIFLQLTLSAADMGRTILAILPFSSKGIDRTTVEVMLEKFTIAMVDAGVYSIVEKKQLDKALSDLKFQSGDVFDDSSAVELGKTVGAQIVIFGSVNYAAGTYYINVKGVDVTTGVASFWKREETSNKNYLVKMADKLAEEVISFGSGSKSARGKKSDSSRYKFTREDQDFIEEYYEIKWDISTNDRYENRRKFNQFIAAGSALASVGGIFSLSGIIIMSSMAVMGANSGIFMMMGLPAGLPILFGGFTMLPLCAIPFWFANRVQTIYRKATGERLSFWDKTNFDLRIVTTKESLTNELNRKISFDLTVSL